jgi:hypothetical protein
MSTDPVNHFLLTLQVPAAECRVRHFGSDYEAALEAYDLAEAEAFGRDDLDIVLVGADSLETVKRTHSSYFDTEQTFESLLPAGILNG